MNIIKRLIDKFSDKTGLYKYSDYEEYKKSQIDGNLRKINCVWVAEDNIRFLADYIKRTVPDLKFGICHGTRRGEEQKLFRELLGIEVIGTEISPTASQFPYTIEWDFHDIKDEWLDNVDFIYSNSFDHSYDPEKCLDAWMRCVKPAGVCILEWSKHHAVATKTDPFGGDFKMYKDLICKKYQIKDILKGGITGKDKDQNAIFFVVAHRQA